MIMTVFRSILESPAVAAVLQERLAQAEKHGHDPLAEREQSPHRIAQIALDYSRIAHDRTVRGDRQHLEGARKKAVQAAALHLALIDVLDHHINAQAVEAYEQGICTDATPNLFDLSQPPAKDLPS
jgi:hypothetical protein